MEKKMKCIILICLLTTIISYPQPIDSLKKDPIVIDLEPRGLDSGRKSEQLDRDNTFWVAPEIMPFLIDGIEGIQKRIKYPQEALENGIEGKVYVITFVDEYGDVKKAQVIKGIGGGCDEEALKAVKETLFTPGICNGEPCKVRISLPIVFSLE